MSSANLLGFAPPPVQTLCALLDCLLTAENIPSEAPRELYETYFTFACIWAFGGALHQDQVCAVVASGILIR